MKNIFAKAHYKKTALLVAAAFAASAVTFAGSSADVSAEPAANAISAARNTPVVQAAKKVGPAVVGITNKAVVRDWFDMPVETEGVGSGVIFRSDGYIVTNNHVIDGAKELIVSLSDGRSLKGKVVGADEATDLAVVKVDAADLPTAKFADSDQIVVGEPAIAIGNPLGLEFKGSVTSGVVSALNRTLDNSDERVKLLQTDAAINPGNSGGALVNADGEVIGINSIKLAASGVEGMGFAIPSNTVQSIINEIMEKGYVAHPYLGITVFDPETAARFGYSLDIDKGVYIFKLVLGGPSDKAGLQRGDIILKVDGEEVNSVSELRSKVAAHKVGDTVTLTIDRNNHERTVDVTLQEMPQDKK
ncbi:MAG: S1C family serine protease [Mitsuokella sp.]|uniref:S1C family serine protease n=1 Tax=Mitsuokella sp. TaxID=2049034 RepID=UPI003D7F0D60